MKTEIDINTNIITWAIARAGYELQEFIAKVPIVQKWIMGEKKPTVKQLEKFSKKVHLPYGYFFLPDPPKERLPIPFFRTNNHQTSNVSVNVYDTILLMQQRQDWLNDYLKENEFQPLPFVGRFRTRQNVTDIVNSIRTTLGLEENWANRFGTWKNALDNLNHKIEDTGIIMVFNGIVENNTSRPIKVEECRGFG